MIVSLKQVEGGKLLVAVEAISALREVPWYRSGEETGVATQVYCHGVHIANVCGSPSDVIAEIGQGGTA